MQAHVWTLSYNNISVFSSNCKAVENTSYVQPEAYPVIASADFYISLATPNTSNIQKVPEGNIWNNAGAKPDHTLI